MTRLPRGSSLVAATLVAGFALLAGMAGPVLVRAADPVFGTPSIEATFPDGITISQPVTLDAPPARVELLLRYADSPAPEVIEIPAPSAGGSTTLRYGISEGDGHIVPNTKVEARWRITPGGGADPVTGPVATDVYDDARFDWKTVAGDTVRVHWYEGGAAFGERALRIGEDSVASTAELLGVSVDEPVDFFIYADREPFYDALGPGTRENVGGTQIAGIRTLFTFIGPDDLDDPWVGIVVPHELVHLVFDTAASNPYHFPPRWLNEGLAVYLTQGYDASDRAMVENAARDGSLISLAGLVGQFPTSAERFYLAYALSVSAVDFLVREYGQDALVSLVRSYADGRTDDEAFQAAIGTDVGGFEAAWLADLGAEAPVRFGPQPPAAGPEPAAWQGSGGSGGGSPPGAGASAGATPGPATGGGTGVDGGDPLPMIALVGALLLGVVAIIGLVASSRRRRDRPDPMP